ncbi:MAG: carbohydrate kinase family protein [Paludibacteraceae bacterium]|nr:carbohydrate kinase family protein [Paludibacteraceae bacterium]MBR6064887.1 carbohydrate kinase family protein [Paludibacteraceae bacterium]
MDTLISIIGGANMDMSATLNGAFIAADSNPGHIEVGYGGVARNIAHNLALLGARTQLLTIFGGDLFGGLMHDYCKQQGIDVHLSERESSQRSGIYLCLHNQAGEMITAVADTEAIRLITPEWLAKRIGEINMSEFIVADTNVTEDSIRWLMENVTAPLFIDGVSSTKAHRVVNALRKCKLPYLHTLKLNLKEALAVTETATYSEAAQQLLDLGVAHVYITLGAEGVYCRNAAEEWLFPILPGEIVNTTGAGDAFLAGVVFAYAKGISFPQTAQYGLMAARTSLMSPKAVNPDIANILL